MEIGIKGLSSCLLEVMDFVILVVLEICCNFFFWFLINYICFLLEEKGNKIS